MSPWPPNSDQSQQTTHQIWILPPTTSPNTYTTPDKSLWAIPAPFPSCLLTPPLLHTPSPLIHGHHLPSYLTPSNQTTLTMTLSNLITNQIHSTSNPPRQSFHSFYILSQHVYINDTYTYFHTYTNHMNDSHE